MQGEVKLAVNKMTFSIGTDAKGNQEVWAKFKMGETEGEGSGFSIQKLARPMYWQKYGFPIYVKIGSDQLAFDLKVERIDFQLGLPDTNQAGLPVMEKEKPATEEKKATQEEPGCHCGYAFTKGELAENILCPVCGQPPSATQIANQAFDDLEAERKAIPTEKPKRKSRSKKEKPIVTTTPPIDTMSKESQGAVIELATKAADVLKNTAQVKPGAPGSNHDEGKAAAGSKEEHSFTPVGPEM